MFFEKAIGLVSVDIVYGYVSAEPATVLVNEFVASLPSPLLCVEESRDPFHNLLPSYFSLCVAKRIM